MQILADCHSGAIRKGQWGQVRDREPINDTLGGTDNGLGPVPDERFEDQIEGPAVLVYAFLVNILIDVYLEQLRVVQCQTGLFLQLPPYGGFWVFAFVAETPGQIEPPRVGF